MTKQEQIEEMMQVIFDYVNSKGMKNVYIVGNEFASDMKSYFHNFGVAEALYNAGYRKTPDGGCVLNKQENQNFIKFVTEQKKKQCKATAQEFAEKLKEKAINNCHLGGHCQEVVHIDDIDKLLKEYE